MKLINAILFLSFIGLSSINAQTPATLDMLSGVKKDIILISQDEFSFKVQNQRGKEKLINKQDVLSITINGQREAVYKPKEDELSFEQMMSYTEGRAVARNYQTAPTSAIVGFVVGTAGAYYLNFWGFLITSSVAIADGSIKPFTYNKKTSEYKERMSQDSNFKSGYDYQAKKKKIKNQFIGGSIGIVVGYGIREYMNNKEE